MEYRTGMSQISLAVKTRRHIIGTDQQKTLEYKKSRENFHEITVQTIQLYYKFDASQARGYVKI